jgi:hypothetical protein
MMKEIILRYFRAMPVLLIIFFSLGCAQTRQCGSHHVGYHD